MSYFYCRYTDGSELNCFKSSEKEAFKHFLAEGLGKKIFYVKNSALEFIYLNGQKVNDSRELRKKLVYENIEKEELLFAACYAISHNVSELDVNINGQNVLTVEISSNVNIDGKRNESHIEVSLEDYVWGALSSVKIPIDLSFLNDLLPEKKEVIPHEFIKNGKGIFVCKSCGKDLFDVENPKGNCDS